MFLHHVGHKRLAKLLILTASPEMLSTTLQQLSLALRNCDCCMKLDSFLFNRIHTRSLLTFYRATKKSYLVLNSDKIYLIDPFSVDGHVLYYSDVASNMCMHMHGRAHTISDQLGPGSGPTVASMQWYLFDWS